MTGPIPPPGITYDTWVILDTLNRLERILMATQADIDALTSRITAAAADIRADIQALKDANPDLDLSALESKVAGLEGLAAENPPES